MPVCDLNSATSAIVHALTRAIVEHRLVAGSKLAEQKLAAQFGVSRTLIRQALFQLSQQGLIRMEPARGAFVASPSVDEARQVFAVRRMLEAEMIRALVRHITSDMIAALTEHVQAERSALAGQDTHVTHALLGDFHVRLAQGMGNEVLTQLLESLVSRCALIALVYPPASAPSHTLTEHEGIVQALAARNEILAVRRMDDHLRHVEAALNFPPPGRNAPPLF